MKTFIKTVKIAVIAAAFALFLAPTAFADGVKAEYIDVDAGHYDLLRAHNERMIVFFGHQISFKRYNVVDMLHQYFTLASEVHGGVRYNIHEEHGQKTLIID